MANGDEPRNLKLNIDIKEIAQVCCPACQEKIVKLVSAKNAEAVIRQTLGLPPG